MRQTTLVSENSLSPELKQAAVEAILKSHTFARADQLKSFLKYICEMEQAGRGHELTEYRIGVEALGRPSSYSPSDDSAVRNRAFALRKKLQDFYEVEQPNAPVRIELNRGSYCPHFLTFESDAGESVASPNLSEFELLPATHQEAPVAVADVPVEPRPKLGWRPAYLGFAVGVMVTLLLAATIYWLAARRSAGSAHSVTIAPIVGEAWGPLFKAGDEVVVCVANPPSVSIHSDTISGKPEIAFNDPHSRIAPAEISDWMKGRFPALTDKQYLTPTTNATYWGDALAAITTYKMLGSAGAQPSLFPERVLSIPALRQRNVVLIGSDEYSPAISHFMEKCPLQANFLTCIAPNGHPEQPLFQIKRDQSRRLTQVYGLITVLPSDSAVNQQHRTIIFSGINSAGTQAAAEFFTSPENLNTLKQQLAKDGHATFPPAYQVVIRGETDDNILLNYHYETYRIVNLPRPQ